MHIVHEKKKQIKRIAAELKINEVNAISDLLENLSQSNRNQQKKKNEKKKYKQIIN